MDLAARFSSSSRQARSVSARSENLRAKEGCEMVERDVVRVVTGGEGERAGRIAEGRGYLEGGERRTGGCRGGGGERRRGGDGRGPGKGEDRHGGSARTVTRGPSYPATTTPIHTLTSSLYYFHTI